MMPHGGDAGEGMGMSTSVVRALRILELLSKTDKPMALTPIAEELDIPKSTCHAILRALASRSFVEVGEHTSYSIGLRAFEVGTAYLRSTDTVEIVTPQLVEVTRTLGVTAHFAVLEEADAVYLCKEDPPGLGLKLASSVGARLPARSTAVGKACLAWLPEGERRLHAPQPAQAGDDGTLEEELAAVRERGYSTDDGETARGVRCVASPVFSGKDPMGAIGVSYLLGSELAFESVVAEVTRAAGRASMLLGNGGRR